MYNYSYQIFLYDFCLGEPVDWQHVPGIDDAAFLLNKSLTNYQDAVDSCQRIGGKVFEPTEATNNPVYKWVNEKSSSYLIWLGIKWSKKHSEFQYQSNGTRISWSNLGYTRLTSTSCGKKSCVDDNAAVGIKVYTGKWDVTERGDKRPTVCETTVS